MTTKAKAPTDKPSSVEYLTDPQLLNLSISPAQETAVRAFYGLPLINSEQHDIFKLCTGREYYVPYDYAEATYLCGARAGKDSRIACPSASYEAAFGDHHKHLARGEHAVISLVAPGREQTRIAFDYIKSHFMESKLLRSMLEDEPTAGEIKLTNRTRIATFPSTKASLRGWSIPCAIEDESGFFRLEGSVDSDAEIQASIRRGMIGFPRTKLLKISTPYFKSGVLYDDFKNHFGKDSADILVWRAPSILMNPSLKASRLEREKRLDPLRFAREYLAEFSEDLDSFLPSAWIEAAVVAGRHELAPTGSHVASVDVSGLGSGANADAFSLNISHGTADGKAVQDLMRGWKKSRGSSINLSGILAEIKTNLDRYNLSSVHGDAYGKTWVSERFGDAGIAYIQTENDKSFYYLAMEPLFAQGRVELLDNDEIQREFKTLERRMMPGGKIKIDHPRGLHDDHANAFSIAAAIALQSIGNGIDEFLRLNAGGPNRTFHGGHALSEPLSDGSAVNQIWDSGYFSSKGSGGWSL